MSEQSKSEKLSEEDLAQLAHQTGFSIEELRKLYDVEVHKADD